MTGRPPEPAGAEIGVEPSAAVAGQPDAPPISGQPGSPAARRVEKPWGHELIWAVTDRYAGKILVIEAGRRLSLQRHEAKDESILVLEGRLALELEDDDGVIRRTELGPGDHRRVPTGRIHRYGAIERCRLVEVSTPELDDVVRLEDDFGRQGTTAP